MAVMCTIKGAELWAHVGSVDGHSLSRDWDHGKDSLEHSPASMECGPLAKRGDHAAYGALSQHVQFGLRSWNRRYCMDKDSSSHSQTSGFHICHTPSSQIQSLHPALISIFHDSRSHHHPVVIITKVRVTLSLSCTQTSSRGWNLYPKGHSCIYPHQTLVPCHMSHHHRDLSWVLCHLGTVPTQEGAGCPAQARVKGCGDREVA